jgi:hypothetical protein
MRTGYDMLADLAERELELVNGGAIEELPRIHDERDAVLASLPQHPPESARDALQRASIVQARVTVALEMRRNELAAELSRLGQGRVMLRGYRPPGHLRTDGIDRTG